MVIYCLFWECYIFAVTLNSHCNHCLTCKCFYSTNKWKVCPTTSEDALAAKLATMDLAMEDSAKGTTAEQEE